MIQLGPQYVKPRGIIMKLTRRGFLITGALIGGGVVVGTALWPERKLALKAKDGEAVLSGWLKISNEGKITVVVPQAEMGQGVTTSLPMLVAEELNVNWEDVGFEFAPHDAVYVNYAMMTSEVEDDENISGVMRSLAIWGSAKLAAVLGVQATGGSSSIRNTFDSLRHAGATARDMLIRVAAKSWDVPSDECVAEAGVVRHLPSGQSLGYGPLAELASLLSPREDVPLKDPADWTLLGTAAPRLDVLEKVDGSAQFGADIRMDGMVYAAIRMAPTFGGVLEKMDASQARSEKDVVDVVALPGAYAVVAKTTWAAKKALDLVAAEFSNPHPVSSADLRADYQKALESGEARVFEETEVWPENFSPNVERHYFAPYLAHTPMEPMNATAHVVGGKCQLWLGHQSISFLKAVVARELDMDEADIDVHIPYLGGGFGRRIESDVAVQAARISKAVGRPVQLIWSREDDVQHDMYRPMSMVQMKADVDADGVRAFHSRGVSQAAEGGFMSRTMPAFGSQSDPDPASTEGIAGSVYDMDAKRIEHVNVLGHVPVGFWRSVGHSQNAFFMESFMDELAHDVGAHPFEFRMKHLQSEPRVLALMAKLRQMSDFDAPLPEGEGRGLAVHRSFGSIVGEVAHVRVVEGEVKVLKVDCVVDCGPVVNPDTVKAQMESGIIYGLTAAFMGDIELADGAVVQSNFHDYNAVRMAESPRINVAIMASNGSVGGVGEPGTPPIAPAVANAIFSAVGQRVREMPFQKNGFVLV